MSVVPSSSLDVTAFADAASAVAKVVYAWEGGAILCGDARKVVPLLPDGSVDMLWADPPYGHNNNNGDLIHRREAALGRLPSGCDSPPEARPIANDGAQEASDLVRWFFAESRRVLTSPGCCCCCCCGGGGPDPQFARWSLWMDESLAFKQMVIWDKGPMGMGWHYRRSYETVLVGEKPGGPCRWFDMSDKIENVIRHIRKKIPRQWEHPTAKPVALVRWFLKLHSQPEDVVVDPFMGCGPSAVAAAAMKRRFIGIELDEKMCSDAAERVRFGRETGKWL